MEDDKQSVIEDLRIMHDDVSTSDPTMEDWMTYEEERLANIRKNEQLLESLGLASDLPLHSLKPFVNGKRKRSVNSSEPQHTPSRTSKRLSKEKSSRETDPGGLRRSLRVKKDDSQSNSNGVSKYVQLPDDWDDRQMGRLQGNGRGDRSRPHVLPPAERVKIPVVEYDETQGGEMLEMELPMSDERLPIRLEDGSGRFVFEGRWKGVFEPNLSPEEIFRGGAFGGDYFALTYSNVLHRSLPSEPDLADLCSSWLEATSTQPTVDVATYLTAEERDPSINRFKKPAGQGLKEWEKSGWIWAGDPRGWMQWYVRFFRGRRCADDERQVRRWLNLAGPSGRFSRSLMKKIASHPGSGGAVSNNSAVENEEVGTVLRQVCWQWAWELNVAEWNRRVGGVK